MNKLILTILSFALITSSFAQGGKKDKKAKNEPSLTTSAATAGFENGIYAEFITTKGSIMCMLEYEKTPMTVANFVGLAEGGFTADGHTYPNPFYNGVKFHRVINNFMIQGGDPLGNGSGGPDHRLFDEARSDLKHSGPGILSMANSDPQGSKKPYSNTGKTNGSQFFITHKATPHLDGLHTVFGHVISGQDVVNAIVQDDVITKLKIHRVGEDAVKWNATDVFAFESSILTPEGQVAVLASNKARMEELSISFENLKKEKEAIKKEKKKAVVQAKMDPIDKEITKLKAQNVKVEAIQTEMRIAAEKAAKEKAIQDAILAKEKIYTDKVSKMTLAEFNSFFLKEVQKTDPNAKQTPSGLVYVIDEIGSGEKVVVGSQMTVHCTGNFRRDGSKFFSTKDAPGKPMTFGYQVDRMVLGWEEGLAMLSTGGKARFFLPYHLAYGAEGRNGGIPPYSDLIFTTEVLNVGQPTAPPVHNEHDGHNH